MASDGTAGTSQVFRWVLDVQPEWPCSDNIKAGRDAASRWAVENNNQRALNLLTSDEREKVLRFYHVRDAKLSLASQLLKHCAVVQNCRVSWAESVIGKDENHKPCFIPADGAKEQLQFNVSHHGYLVALAGCTNQDVRIGVDVVQVDTSKDLPRVREEGWPSWVRTYEAVFSAREVQDIITWTPQQSLNEEESLKAKLRHFYAHWCLKEAYVKMTGEALMAPWLQQMEFRNVKEPKAQTSTGDNWGGTFSDVEIWHDGRLVTGVKMELQAFRNDYMIGTATSAIDVPFSPFQLLDLQRDIYPVAESKS
ncbi:MAG: hypothetical protein L6R40_007784 [Gallowayella cf. fulva]|nr:MAG: hypothetical protein L6R40_007784 [Xanthomendoza cf. fulva]